VLVMLVLQHNCRKAYAITIAALELGLQLGVGLVCLQEPYIDGVFSHGGFLLYWPEGERRSCRVVIAVRKDLLNQLIIEARMDLANHPYILVVDIWELRAQEKARRTRIINCYDNWIGASCCWQGESTRRRRAIEDADWGQIIGGRCLFLGDFNAHSPLWNSQVGTRVNAGPLEALIEDYDLYINNDPDTPTRPKSTPGILIIDLAFTNQALGPLSVWALEQDHPTGSDHEAIVLGWEELGEGEVDAPIEAARATTGWQIQDLLGDSETLGKAFVAWKDLAASNPPLLDSCLEEDIAREAL
jgi:Endonuclease-reverse transcriptase